MSSLFSKKIVSLFAGFSGVGILTTLISFAGIYIFIELLGTPLLITYCIIYFVTILISYLLNSLIVFDAGLELKKAVKYFMIYLTGMGIGVVVLYFLKEALPYENYILAYLVIPVTMMWNFILSFLLFKQKRVC